MDPAHERLLALAGEERRLRNSPRWKTAMDEAIEAHGEACERLYEELYRQLDALDGKDIEPLPSTPNIRKEVRREIVMRLKGELPGMIAAALDDCA